MNILSRIENKLLALAESKLGFTRKKFKSPYKPSSICFVCMGNICRSAYAEEKLEKILGETNLRIFSSGLATTAGKPANSDAIRIAKDRGINLKEHKTSNFLAEDFKSDNESLIFCMEPWQERAAKKLAKNQPVFLLSNLDTNVPPFIRDPYGKSDEEFNRCFDNIDICLQALAEWLNKDPK